MCVETPDSLQLGAWQRSSSHPQHRRRKRIAGLEVTEGYEVQDRGGSYKARDHTHRGAGATHDRRERLAAASAAIHASGLAARGRDTMPVTVRTLRLGPRPKSIAEQGQGAPAGVPIVGPEGFPSRGRSCRWSSRARWIECACRAVRSMKREPVRPFGRTIPRVRFPDEQARKRADLRAEREKHRCWLAGGAGGP